MASITINVPSSELGFFKALVAKMGRTVDSDSERYSRADYKRAAHRADAMRQFVDTFSDNDIPLDVIDEETEFIRKEMYEKGRQKD